MPEKLKILVIGQTPPPYGGQAIMIDHIVKAKYKSIEVFHVRMQFSKEMNEKGSLNFHKLLHFFEVIFKTYKLKIKHGISIIYYPPSNSPKTSVYRDIIILLPTRFLFKKTILHFHAAGLSEAYTGFGSLGKFLIKTTFNKPDLTIANSRFNPDDGAFFKSKINSFIPYGIPDNSPPDFHKYFYNGARTLNVLFVGILNSTKGEGYTMEAVSILIKKGYNIKLFLAGVFESDEYKVSFFERLKELRIENHVEHLGVITGDKKREAFLNADVFCFPSFFVSESLGVVLLEAMQFKLPLIATRWRGIQSIVEEDRNGFLVDIKNEHQIAEKLEFLINHPTVLQQLGETGRKIFLEKYTLEGYFNKIETEFCKLKD